MSESAPVAPGAARWPAALTTVALTVLVLGPLLFRGGFALVGDMVFVPDQPWKPGWLGLDGSVPRAVPMDALVSLADEVVPGAVLQRLLLAGALLLAGFGIARLAHRSSAVGQCAAVVVFVWNPWVYERLEIGQWPTVLGYGLLPWLVLAAVGVRDRSEGGWARLTLALAATGVCAPSVGLVSVAVAVVIVLFGADPRRAWGALGLGVLTNLPWIVPAALGPAIRGSDVGFEAFAARGESSLGTLASLLSMGGIWKSAVVAPERGNALVVAAAGLLALVLLGGFRYAATTIGDRTARALGVIAGAALALALLPSIGPVAHALGALSEQVPAVAILRDSHRSLAPLGLVLALGAAAVVDRWAQRRTAAGWLLLVAPLVLLPSMAWGLRGDLDPVPYPQEWSEVADRIDPRQGSVVVLPWTGSYRGFGWNHDRAVLDPAPRFLPGEVLVDDRVFLHGEVVPGEDPFLARVGEALEADDPGPALRKLGVGWILIEKGMPLSAHVPDEEPVVDGAWLRLIELVDQKTNTEISRHETPRWAVSLADATAASAVVISIWHGTRRKMRNSRKQM